MSDFAQMVSFDEARSLISENSQLLGSEEVRLGQSLHRVLAEPVFAKTSQPPFTASAMDGYAVASSVVRPGESYPVQFEVGAGSSTNEALSTGSVARIFTGAPLPEGADAVIIQENAERSANGVAFTASAEPEQNIRKQGRDFLDGQLVAEAGQLITPAVIAICAAANVASVFVRNRPRISILSTGNELAKPGTDLKPGQIVGSNGLMLEALFADAGCDVTDHGDVADNREFLSSKLSSILEGSPDILVTTGGASVGDHDLILPVLQSLGAEIKFWKIAMRPGKPVIFAKLGNTLIFGLPGNPVSAFVTAQLLVNHAVYLSSGKFPPATKTARLLGELKANGARRHFVRGRLSYQDAVLCVEPFSEFDSAHLSTLASADCLIDIPENSTPLDSGSSVNVYLMR